MIQQNFTQLNCQLLYLLYPTEKIPFPYLETGLEIKSYTSLRNILFEIDLQLSQQQIKALNSIRMQDQNIQVCEITFILQKSLKKQENKIYQANVKNIQFLWVDKLIHKNTKKRNLLQRIEEILKNHKFILKKSQIIYDRKLLQSELYAICPAWIDRRYLNYDLRVYGKIGIPLNERLLSLSEWQIQSGIYQLLKNCQLMHSPQINRVKGDHWHFSHFHCDIKSDNIVCYQNPAQKRYLQQLRQNKRITDQQYYDMLKRINRWLFIDFETSTTWNDKINKGMTVHITSYYQPPEVHEVTKHFLNQSTIGEREGKRLHAREMMDIWSLGVVISQILLGCKIDTILKPVSRLERASTILNKLSQTNNNKYVFLVQNMLKINPYERMTAEQLVDLFNKQFFYLNFDILSDLIIQGKIRTLPTSITCQKQWFYHYANYKYNFQLQELNQLYACYDQNVYEKRNLDVAFSTQQQICIQKLANTIRLSFQICCKSLRNKIFVHPLKNLKQVVFYSCNLNEIPLIKTMPNLQSLIIIKLVLEKIPNQLPQYYPNLRKLRLQDFQIGNVFNYLILQISTQSIKTLQLLLLKNFMCNGLKFSKDLFKLSSNLSIALDQVHFLCFPNNFQQYVLCQQQSWRNLYQFVRQGGEIGSYFYAFMSKNDTNYQIEIDPKELYGKLQIQEIYLQFKKLANGKDGNFLKKINQEGQFKVVTQLTNYNITKKMKQMRQKKRPIKRICKKRNNPQI